MSCASVKDLIGCNYKTHGRSKEEGFDCFGIVIEVLRRNNIVIPDVNYESIDEYESVFVETQSKIKYKKIEHPIELCVIMFNVKGEPRHTGIYLGDGFFIHATRSGVRVDPLHRWKNRIVGCYKLINS